MRFIPPSRYGRDKRLHRVVDMCFFFFPVRAGMSFLQIYSWRNCLSIVADEISVTREKDCQLAEIP